MADALRQGQSIRIEGLGRFTVRTRQARRYRIKHFVTGKIVWITTKAAKYVAFSPAKAVLDQLNHPNEPIRS